MYIPPEILVRNEVAPAQPPTVPPRSGQSVSAAHLGLTERQADVLALLMQGRSNKAICRILELAEPTVKNHVTAILRALKATNRTEAVITAREKGFDPSQGDE
jgi:DNA-binding NarL/FixJ family response regulator